jgi:hypothetical protein
MCSNLLVTKISPNSKQQHFSDIRGRAEFQRPYWPVQLDPDHGRLSHDLGSREGHVNGAGAGRATHERTNDSKGQGNGQEKVFASRESAKAPVMRSIRLQYAVFRCPEIFRSQLLFQYICQKPLCIWKPKVRERRRKLHCKLCDPGIDSLTMQTLTNCPFWR